MSNEYSIKQRWAKKASLFNRSTVSVTAERFISVVHNRHWYIIIPCLCQTRYMCFELKKTTKMSWYLCKPGWTPSRAASTLCLWWSSPSPGTSPALTSSPLVIQQSRWWSIDHTYGVVDKGGHDADCDRGLIKSGGNHTLQGGTPQSESIQFSCQFFLGQSTSFLLSRQSYQSWLFCQWQIKLLSFKRAFQNHLQINTDWFKANSATPKSEFYSQISVRGDK